MWSHHRRQMDRQQWRFETPLETLPLGGSTLWCPGQSPYLKDRTKNFTFSSGGLVQKKRHMWFQYLNFNHIKDVLEKGFYENPDDWGSFRTGVETPVLWCTNTRSFFPCSTEAWMSPLPCSKVLCPHTNKHIITWFRHHPLINLPTSQNYH